MEPNENQRQGPPLDLPAETGELSEREREILILVANGASNKEVAQQLVISPNTVKVHLRNIFGKIGVSSRTEAALYAVRAGFVRVAADPPQKVEAQASNGVVATPAVALPTAPPAPVLPAAPARRPRWQLIGLIAGVVVVALIATAAIAPRLGWFTMPAASTEAATVSAPPRWQARAGLPTARSHLAAVTYESQVYAIGGEAAGAVTGINERYDPAADSWTTLAPKPQPSADISAAVMGGLIYVPGGRLASGDLTAVVEVYDPIADAWETRAPLPVALSGYSLAAFEGRLYMFGGWNGDSYVASVYEYDPAADDWIERTRMPSARGLSAAVVSGGKIYVIGGIDAQGATRAIEAYAPARDSEIANPWETLADAPANLGLVAATNLADSLYIAGRDEATERLIAWEFRPEPATWQPLDLSNAPSDTPDWLGVVAVSTHLYVLSNPPAGEAASPLMAYQALYTNLIPVITTGD